MKPNKNQKLTAYQQYLNIENEFKHQKKTESILPKCPIHQNNYSKICRFISIIFSSRQCKKIREDIQDEQVYEERDINMDQYYYAQGDRGNNVFPIHGENAGAHVNALIKQNIQTSTYYKELQQIRTFFDLIYEVEKSVTNVETWAVGGQGVPSQMFCCLYRFMNMGLSVDQVRSLCDHKNVYVRCIGLLYIRYAIDPNFLWTWMKRYILDEQELRPCIDKNVVMTVGEFVEKLLTDMNYYNTRLPRIPQQIDLIIQAKILLAREKRDRLIINKKIIGLFQRGSIIRAINHDDDEWHEAHVEQVEGSFIIVQFRNSEKQQRISLGEVEFIPKNEKETEYIAMMITDGITSGQINHLKLPAQEDEKFESGEIPVIEDPRNKSDSSSQSKSSKSSSSSRSSSKQKKKKTQKNKDKRSKKDKKDKKDKKKTKKHKKHKDSRSRSARKDKNKKNKNKNKNNKRERSRNKSKEKQIQQPKEIEQEQVQPRYETNKEREERLLQEVKQKQKNTAVAHSRSDVAKMPQSFKSSITNGVPNSSKHRMYFYYLIQCISVAYHIANLKIRIEFTTIIVESTDSQQIELIFIVNG